MKILKKTADYWNSHKNIPLFKGKVLAVVLIVVAIIVNFTIGTDNKVDKNTSKNDTTSVSEEKESPTRELHIGKSNVIALGVCIAALGAVKIKREKDLNGRHDKVEKNHREE